MNTVELKDKLFNSLLKDIGLLIVAATVAMLAWPSIARAQTSLVRVHQTGYVSNSSKRAYLMSSASSSGASFSVLNSSGTPVYSAAIGASQGTWGTFTHVYALDFDSVTTPGTYTVSVSGSITASSLSFAIDTGANLYSTPLANTLYFYENERDGASFVATPLRTAAGHLNDAHAKVYFTPTFNKKDNAGTLTPTGAVIDASGGWWDAGDYMKFVETHSYVVALMLIGVRDFPNQMGAGSTTSNFTAEAKFERHMEAGGSRMCWGQMRGAHLVVDDGSTFPLCMQHQVTNLIASPPNGPAFLKGAVVEGPNSFAAKGTLTNMVACPPNGEDEFSQFNGNGAIFEDNVQSYSTVEPAIDLTASSFLAFSWVISGGPTGTP